MTEMIYEQYAPDYLMASCRSFFINSHCVKCVNFRPYRRSCPNWELTQGNNCQIAQCSKFVDLKKRDKFAEALSLIEEKKL